VAHALDKHVVAEGVETEGEVAIHRGFGCDHIQGFYYARPLDAEMFAKFARRTTARMAARTTSLANIVSSA
jgi:EAL domain-containing protein (putative c-di-GMP-specific phosphodiesterase class I)